MPVDINRTEFSRSAMKFVGGRLDGKELKYSSGSDTYGSIYSFIVDINTEKTGFDETELQGMVDASAEGPIHVASMIALARFGEYEEGGTKKECIQSVEAVGVPDASKETEGFYGHVSREGSKFWFSVNPRGAHRQARGAGTPDQPQAVAVSLISRTTGYKEKDPAAETSYKELMDLASEVAKVEA